MTVYVVDRWDEEDLCDADVVKVFLKEENAEKYKEEQEIELRRTLWESDEDLDVLKEIPKYRWRITKLKIEELAGNCEYRSRLK